MIEKLKTIFTGDETGGYASPPTQEDIVAKLNEIIDVVNELVKLNKVEITGSPHAFGLTDNAYPHSATGHAFSATKLTGGEHTIIIH